MTMPRNTTVFPRHDLPDSAGDVFSQLFARTLPVEESDPFASGWYDDDDWDDDDDDWDEDWDDDWCDDWCAA